MDTVMQLDPAVGARPSSDFVDFFAAMANTRATDEVRLTDAEGALSAGEAAIDRGVEAIARMVANDRAAAEAGGRVDWDYRIARLQFLEAEAARDIARMRKLVDRIVAGLASAKPAVRRKARALARREEDAVVRFVEALRDARWQMMALRAQFDPDSRTGETFDNPAEMRRSLSAN
jgi:hypothetical protein